MSMRRNLLLSYLATQFKWLPYSYEYIYHSLVPSELPRFNIWDEEWELGNISGDNGQNVSNNSTRRSINYIKVAPNSTYHFYWVSFLQSSSIGVMFYDIAKNFINAIYFYSANYDFVIPSNAYFIRFRIYNQDWDASTIVAPDICINKSNAQLNGHYAPYSPRKVLDKSRILKISGNSEVRNQLVEYPPQGTYTFNGITYNVQQDRIIASGTSTARSNFQMVRTYGITTNHTYLIKGFGKNYDSSKSCLSIVFYDDTSTYISYQLVTTNTLIKVTNSAIKQAVVEVVGTNDTNITINNVEFSPNLHDLSQDYPFNTPTSINDPRVQNIIAQGYLPKNDGEIRNSVISEIESRGFNIWDEETEIGGIDTTTGQNVPSSSNIRSKNYTKVISNANYYAKISTTGNVDICFYDKDYNYIGRKTIYKAYAGSVSPYNIFTTPSNCKYIRIVIENTYGTTYNHDICINRSSSLNGIYKPHIPNDKIQLPAPLELSGVNTARNTFEVTENGYVFTRNVFDVDMGTISYGTQDNTFYINSLDRALTQNGLCSKYGLTPHGSLSSMPDKTIMFRTDTKVIYVKDTSYVSATDFKQASVGVPLYYQLATPQVISIPRKHLGAVDLGTRTFTKDANGVKVTCVISNLKPTLSNANIVNAFISNWKTVSYANASSSTSEHEFACSNSTTTLAFYSQTDFTNLTTQQIAEYFSGTYLFYETQNETTDFVNEEVVESGGEVNGQCARVPIEYQEVEYIESTGNQWIDSGVRPSNTIGFNLTLVSQYDSDQIFYGRQLYMQQGSNGNKVYWGWNNVNTSQEYRKDLTMGVKYNLKHNFLNSRKALYNDQEYSNLATYSTISTSPASSIVIFGRREDNGTINYQSKYRLFIFQISDGQTIIRNFIPVYRKSDSVIGLYDTIEGKFYTNAGTGTFLKGGNVNAPTCEVLPSVDVTYRCK